MEQNMVNVDITLDITQDLGPHTVVCHDIMVFLLDENQHFEGT